MGVGVGGWGGVGAIIGLEVWKGWGVGGGGWGWGWSHDARSKGPMTSTGGGAGCVRGVEP